MRAPYFQPARNGGRPQDKNDSDTEARTRFGARKRRERSTTTNTSGPPAQRTTPEQGQSSGAEGPARATRREADDEKNPRTLNATGVEEQPVYDTVHACDTHGESSVHNGIHPTSNAHPDCPEAIVDKTRQDVVKLQHLGRLQGEGCRCLANHPERAPYLYSAREGGNTNHGATNKNSEPCIYIPPGTAARPATMMVSHRTSH